jgi:4-alpha-glucanotransferase
LWQILPLGPIGADASPYLSSSAFAGNPLLISPEKLSGDGLLSDDDLATFRGKATDQAEFDQARHARRSLLELAAQRFVDRANHQLRSQAEAFFESSAAWLDDFALFQVIQYVHDGSPWHAWPPMLANRDPKALQAFAEAHMQEIEAERIQQFFFERQWAQVRELAQREGIAVIGDIPIFVAQDSADVWAHRGLFKLDPDGMPTVVAGVPPDYFSATGQCWGNPMYRWDEMGSRGFTWWIERLRRLMTQVDRVRVDHFRGFEAAWEIPASHLTAERGRWSAGPGESLFQAVEAALGRLPIIAEDLGLITPEVEVLRDRLGFPGMRVLQFGFNGGPDHPYLPHRYPTNCVAYTGTHDNDTSVGWYEAAPQAEKESCRRYLSSDGTHIAWDLTRAVWGSPADTAIVPMQDLLELGSAARMNTPGTTEGNWAWRVLESQLSDQLAERTRDLNLAYER